jgi:hypothetical protein
MAVDANTPVGEAIAQIVLFFLPGLVLSWGASSVLLAIARSPSTRRADRIVLRVQKMLLGGRAILGKGWTPRKRAYATYLAYFIRAFILLVLAGLLFRIISNAL